MFRSNVSRPASRQSLLAPLAIAAAFVFLQSAAGTAFAGPGPADEVEQADAVYGSARAFQQAAAARYFRPQADAATAAPAAQADGAAARETRAALAANYYRPLPQGAVQGLTREQVRAEVQRERAAGRLTHPYRPYFDENDPLREVAPGVAQGLQPQDTTVN